MLTKKKALTILSVAAIAATLGGCGKNNKPSSSEDNTPKDVALKVWCSTEDNNVMEDIKAKFVEQEKKDHPNVTYAITFENIAEGETRTNLEKDPDAAADVFATTDDSCLAMAETKEIYKIPAKSTFYEHVTKLNGAGSVKGVTYGGDVYGFPETADNGYFLYYNDTYLSADDVKTFEGIVSKAASLEKKFYYDYNNGWYAVSYLNCNGGTLGFDENGTFCNWKDTALAPLKAMYAQAANPALVAESGNANVVDGMKDGSVVAAVSGTWNYAGLKEGLGDHLKCVELPTLTVDGKAKHLSSFSGGKVVCVNAVTKNPTEAMRFADFMTNEQSQTTRFNMRAIGPSNIAAASSDAVKINPAIAALAAQSAYSVSQSAALNKKANSVYWDAAGGLGKLLSEQKSDEAALKTALDKVVDTIVADE